MKPESISVKDIVRERYQSAQAQNHEAVYQIGQNASGSESLLERIEGGRHMTTRSPRP